MKKKIAFLERPILSVIQKKPKTEICSLNLSKRPVKNKIFLEKKKKVFLNRKILVENPCNSFFLLKEIERTIDTLKIESFFIWELPFEFMEELPSKKFLLFFLNRNIEQESFLSFQFFPGIWYKLNCFPNSTLNNISQTYKKSGDLFFFEINHQKKKPGKKEKKKFLAIFERRNVIFTRKTYYERSFYESFLKIGLVKGSLEKFHLVNRKTRKKKTPNLIFFSEKSLLLAESSFLSCHIYKNKWGNEHIIHKKWCKTSFKGIFFKQKKKANSSQKSFSTKKKKFIIYTSVFKWKFSTFSDYLKFRKNVYRSFFFDYFEFKMVKILILFDHNLAKFDSLLKNFERKKGKKDFQIFCLEVKKNLNFANFKKMLKFLKKKNFQGVVFIGSLDNLILSTQIFSLSSNSTLNLSKIFSGINYSFKLKKSKIYLILRLKSFSFWAIPFNVKNGLKPFVINQIFGNRNIDIYVFIINPEMFPLILDYSILISSKKCLKKKISLFFNKEWEKKNQTKIFNSNFFFSKLILLRFLGKFSKNEKFYKIKEKNIVSLIILVIFFLKNLSLFKKKI